MDSSVPSLDENGDAERLARLADRIMVDASMSATIDRLEAETRRAAEVERQIRQLGLLGVVQAVQRSPLLAVMTELISVPLVEQCAIELNPEEIAVELRAGERVGAVAIRHALALAARGEELPWLAGGKKAAVATLLGTELALPEQLAQQTAARFVCVYLLLAFATLVQQYFDQPALDEVIARLEGDPGALARFVRTFWLQANSVTGTDA